MGFDVKAPEPPSSESSQGLSVSARAHQPACFDFLSGGSLVVRLRANKVQSSARCLLDALTCIRYKPDSQSLKHLVAASILDPVQTCESGSLLA